MFSAPASKSRPPGVRESATNHAASQLFPFPRAMLTRPLDGSQAKKTQKGTCVGMASISLPWVRSSVPHVWSVYTPPGTPLARAPCFRVPAMPLCSLWNERFLRHGRGRTVIHFITKFGLKSTLPRKRCPYRHSVTVPRGNERAHQPRTLSFSRHEQIYRSDWG